MKIRIKKGEKYIGNVVKYILLFFYLFDAHFAGLGVPTFVTSKRVSVILILCLVLTKNRWKKNLPSGIAGKSYIKLTILTMVVLLYSGLLRIAIGAGNGIHVFTSLLFFCLTGIVGTFALYCLFDNLDDFMRALIIVCVVQVIIICFFAFFPSIQVKFDELLGVVDLNADYRRRGYMTGFACSTSRGVLRLSMGMIGCLYMGFNERKQSVKYLLLFCVIGVTATILARTGFVITFIGILLLLWRNFNYDFKLLIKVLNVLLLLIFIAVGVIVFFDLGDELQVVFKRLIHLFENGLYDSFLRAYLGQNTGSTTIIPELMKETIIGTGITSGVSGNGIVVNADGGYVRLYVALGLPMAILFYLNLFFTMLKPVFKIKEHRVVRIYMLFIIWVIGETKEYYLMEGYAIAFYFAMLLLQQKSLKRLDEKNRLL